jgi:hypothetical protein
MPDRLREKFVFLLTGFGSEYSLRPIARHLEESGIAVLAADMQTGPLPPFPDKPTVLITSQHPSCSSAAFRLHWGQRPPYSNYIGPLEIMRDLRPACSVFVPHDLEAPIRPDELSYMSAFDIYCSPFPRVNPALHRACRVVQAGWVKHDHFDDLDADSKAAAKPNGVFFLNQVISVLQAGGGEYLRANFPSMFSGELPVKLPSWPGCAELGENLRELGAKLIRTQAPSTKLIAASPRIYVNAPGSVIAEAWYVGTPVIHAGEAGCPDRPLTPFRPFQGMPRFNFDLLLNAIADHVKSPP